MEGEAPLLDKDNAHAKIHFREPETLSACNHCNDRYL